MDVDDGRCFILVDSIGFKSRLLGMIHCAFSFLLLTLYTNDGMRTWAELYVVASCSIVSSGTSGLHRRWGRLIFRLVGRARTFTIVYNFLPYLLSLPSGIPNAWYEGIGRALAIGCMLFRFLLIPMDHSKKLILRVSAVLGGFESRLLG